MSNIPKFKKITHVFLSGKFSSTIIIPIDTARKYGLDKPSNVVVEEREDGILIKPVEISELNLRPTTSEPTQTRDADIPGVNQDDYRDRINS